MFSPDPAIRGSHSSSLRNPRRRQRKDSDSLKQQPQRKRSKLSEESYLEPSSAKANGNGAAVPNGKASHGSIDRASYGVEIPVREKKHIAAPKRTGKADGLTTLTKNANYSIKQLPAFPERLRNNPATFRTFVLPSASHALVITHENAIIWDYSSPAPTPVTVTLPLPFSPKPSDPLPVGSLVKSGPSGELGLVLVSPTTGKIMFWENVDTVESFGVFQQGRNSIEGSIGSIYSGEIITDIVDAEHAGFVLIFNTGRLAQLTIRDAQGRPQVNVHFLRNTGNNGSGLFGSFKNVFGGGWRKDIAAVKTRPSQAKGQMETITATKSGSFQFWDLSWAGQHIFRGDIDLRSQMLDTLRNDRRVELGGHEDDVKIMDFAILSRYNPKSTDSFISTHEDPVNLLILISITGPSLVRYALVEARILESTANVERVIVLHTYAEEKLSDTTPAPKLLVPQPGHTAFVLFKHAAVVASLMDASDLGKVEDAFGPVKTLEPFQDAIHFRLNRGLQFVGHGIEPVSSKDRQSNCIVFVAGYGVLRFTASSLDTEDKKQFRSSLTAKSKIEQAVYFSSGGDNIIDFAARPEIVFTHEEIEEAVLLISHEILTSNSDYIPLVTLSTEHQLDFRVKAMRRLTNHVRANYPPLSRLTKWKLLWDAEKMAAAQGIWRCYDDRQARKKPEVKDLLAQILEYFHESYKTELRPELGEVDPVRQWFVRDLQHLHIIVPWAYQIIKELRDDGIDDEATLIRYVNEGGEIMITALETAFKFREESLSYYGLELEDLSDGILSSGYEGLGGEVWTSTHNTVNSVRQLADVSRKFAWNYFEASTSTRSDDLDPVIIMKIAADNPRLVHLCCQTHTERYRTLLAQDNESVQAAGRSMKADFELIVRPKELTQLAQIGMAYKGMELAEKYRDMPSLVELVTEEVQFLEMEAEEDDDPKKVLECKRKLAAMELRIDGYFKKFGDPWARALYAWHIKRDTTSTLFTDQYMRQPSLTTFLRGDSSRAKLSWINDILGQKDMKSAGASLLTVACEQETNAWSKKVELSLAKLALMAAEEISSEPASADIQKLSARTTTEMRIAAIQEQLYDHIKPTIYGALDHDSAVQLFLETYGATYGGKKAFYQLLREGFEELSAHKSLDPGLLIDMLTLIDSVSSGETVDISGQEFWLALQVLDAAWDQMSPITRNSTLKLIWKRCYVRDDWEAINNTTDKSDEEVELVMASTALYRTLLAGGEATGIWTRPSNVAPISPTKVLGAGCDPMELSARFPSEDIRTPIMQDNVEDDEALQAAIEGCRLDFWFEQMKQTVAEQMQREAEEEAALATLERETEEQMWQAELERVQTGLRARLENGTHGENGGMDVDG